MKYTYTAISTFCCQLLFFVFLSISAVAQQKTQNKITLDVKNATLEQIIQSVKKQTGVNIVYNHEILKDIPKISIKAKNEDLKSVMTRVLKNTNLVFEMQDNVMVIGPKEVEKEKSKKFDIIKGQVVDETGKGIPLVTVSIKGMPNRTFSNLTGEFSIDVPEGKNLLFSYVGFQPRIIKPIPGQVLAVTMKTEEQEMDEVVVTGFQRVDKRLSASSTFTLKAADVIEPGVTNIVSMLQGKVPGLSVVNNSGSPNAVPKMRMRGTSTLMGNANPIIVVDGFIRENPTNVNPDNIMANITSPRDMFFGKEGYLSSASLVGNSISGLNVNDIESITFLKDASATAIYGTSAANGVIMITTKSGSAGKLSVNYSLNTGFVQKPSYNGLKLMNSQERVRLSREMYADGLFYGNKPSNLGYEGAFFQLMNREISEMQFQQKVAELESMNTDWFDILFQNSLNNSHHLSFSGGSDKIRLYSSLFYDNTNGSAKEDWQKRTGGSIRASMDLHPKLKLDFNLNASYRVSNGYYTVNPLDYALKTSRAISPDTFYPTTKPSRRNTMASLNFNFLNEIAETGSSTKNTGADALLSLTYKPFSDLSLRSSAQTSINQLNAETFASERSNFVSSFRGYDIGTIVPGSSQELESPLPFGGFVSPEYMSTYNYTFRNSAEYTKRLFEERDQFTVQAGFEARGIRHIGHNNMIPGYLPDRGEGFFLFPTSYYYNNPRRTNRTQNSVSIYGIAAYSIQDKYILNANIRSDASNRFGQYANSRFLPVWSISGRWNISSENWLKNSKIINQLDIKASYGFQGNVVTTVGPNLIVSIPDQGMGYSLANEYTLKLKSLPYPDLKWEKTKTYNLELHASLFNSKIDFTVAYYDKRTTDAITDRPIPIEYGMSSMIINGGNLSNKGYEANISFSPVRSKDFNWRVSTNTSKNIGLIEKGVGSTFFLKDYLNGSIRREGLPMNTFYVFSFKGLNPKNGVPMFNNVEDGAGNGKPYESLLIRAGSKDPNISGGLSNQISYKAFSLGMNLSFSLGAKKLLNPLFEAEIETTEIPMPDRNAFSFFANRWRKPGDELHTNIPALAADISQIRIGLPGGASESRYFLFDHSDQRLVSADFLRCRSMTFSYTLNPKWINRLKIKRASISGNVTNPFVIADRRLDGEDPEIEGIGTTALPISPTYSMSLNVTF